MLQPRRRAAYKISISNDQPFKVWTTSAEDFTPIVAYELVNQLTGALRPVYGSPIRIDNEKVLTPLPPPLLGVHTDEVLADWGLK